MSVRRISLYSLAVVLASITVACSSEGSGDVAPTQTSELAPTAEPAPTSTAIPAPTPESSIADFIRDGWLQERANDGWDTDISKYVPDLKVGVFTKPSDLINRDGIPSIDTPEFAPASNAPDYLRPEEPVIQVNVDGIARAYPLSILMWHEIVNDVIGGQPVTVTFCPLCNSSIAFSGTHEGQSLDFGTTGWIATADLVMYDRQTQTWWQQITGEGLIGEFAGTTLTFLPSSIVGWQDFADQYPDGQVLKRPTPGTIHPISGQEITRNRTYDDAPYSGYDVAGSLPNFFKGSYDPTLQPVDRVVALNLSGNSVAYPFRALVVEPVVNDSVGDQEIVILYDDGTESPFRLSAAGHDFQTSGSTTVFSRQVNDQTLTFAADDAGTITDAETGTTWDKFGRATEGQLIGTQLEAIVHGQGFWFAIAAFRPDTEVRLLELLVIE